MLAQERLSFDSVASMIAADFYDDELLEKSKAKLRYWQTVLSNLCEKKVGCPPMDDRGKCTLLETFVITSEVIGWIQNFLGHYQELLD